MLVQIILCGVLLVFSGGFSAAGRRGRRRVRKVTTPQPSVRTSGSSKWYDSQVRFRLDSLAVVDANLKLICSMSVSGKVPFKWKFNGATLKENERIRISSLRQQSILYVRKAKTTDTGLYTCVTKYRGSTNESTLFVEIKSQPNLMLTPRSAIIEKGKSVQLHCENLEKNSTVLSMTLSRRYLPDGRWYVVHKGATWNWTSTFPSTKTDLVIFEFVCEAKTTWGTTVHSPTSKITVVPSGSLFSVVACPAEVHEGIQWEKTVSGMVDTQTCYNGTGEATRLCESVPDRPPVWKEPNLGSCSSVSIKAMEDEIAASDEGFNVSVNITKTLTELSELTRLNSRPKHEPEQSTRIYGKDLLSSVQILRRAKDFIQRSKQPGELAKKNLTPFTVVTSNLLHVRNKETWDEIDKDNPDTPAQLITALEEFGFGVENETDGDRLNEVKEQNLIVQVRHIGSQSELRKTGLTVQQNESLIHFPSSVFDDSLSVTVVSIIYETLAYVLTDLNASRGAESDKEDSNSSIAFLPGSKMISSTVKPLGSEKFRQPVKIVMDHHVRTILLVKGRAPEKNTTDRRRCVFWKPEEAASRWGDEGCRVVAKETNEYVTTCECDHLTLFAVMMNLNGHSMSSSQSSILDIISTIGSSISLMAVTLTVITYVIFWRSLKSPRVVNLLNLCFSIGLLDIFSILRSPQQENEGMCRAIGILLHFFLLALFLWMLCEGILLYCLMTDIFKKHYGKRWYMFAYILGWGLPAVVVGISVGIMGPSQYGRAGNCWLTKENGFIWAALAPITGVLLVNYIVFGVMLRRLLSSRKVQDKDTSGKMKAGLRAAIVILPVLGFTWTFAVLDFFFEHIALKYMFAIFNSLQGFFIFLFHCLLNHQVQQALCGTRGRGRKRMLSHAKTQDIHSQHSIHKIDKLTVSIAHMHH